MWCFYSFELSDAKCNQTNQNVMQQNLSEISEFSILFIGPNRKLGNLRKFHIFLIKPHHKVIFLLSQVFFLFLDFEFFILPKIKVNENFPIFPSFRFQV